MSAFQEKKMTAPLIIDITDFWKLKKFLEMYSTSFVGEIGIFRIIKKFFFIELTDLYTQYYVLNIWNWQISKPTQRSV